MQGARRRHGLLDQLRLLRQRQAAPGRGAGPARQAHRRQLIRPRTHAADRRPSSAEGHLLKNGRAATAETRAKTATKCGVHLRGHTVIDRVKYWFAAACLVGDGRPITSHLLGLGPLRSQTVGPAATAQEAIAMVVERLPAGCGPAFLGTPEELATHEATTKRHPN
ncbi:DUF6193 family natural product biosynthesis protein [Streptomyces griseofuscus]|uniref:DUF6193 family natural product biosynthesis protein n=1 Tax=Streptomyces griseofuscus TaxID=146922 RepID=UPI0034549E03